MIFISSRKDLIGEQFDELTVVEMLWNYQNKHRTYCRCTGIDNKEYIVRQDVLVSGATHTIHGACSEGTIKDISGKRFGKLIAIKPTEKRASNGSIRWECICDCGNIVYPTINNLKRGHTTSCGCAKDKFIESCKINITGKKFGYLTVLSEFPYKKGSRRKVKCLCECGNIHICAVSDLTTGHTMSCGCINISKGELYIEEILNDLNLYFEKQKRFKECKNKRSLPFDFYIPQYNVCIEYDGEQHYKLVKYWGGEEKFLQQQLNDELKNEFCKENNINLVRISYPKTKQEIFEIINNLTSPATTTT